MTKKKLHLDFTPELRAKLKAHADKWSEFAMGTERCDRAKVTRGINGMYEAAGLKKPRIVFVDSPLTMAFVYGAAAWWWHCQKNGNATRAATDAATYAATDAATDAATYAATDAATSDAIDAATSDAIDAATYAATRDATSAATYAATDAATRDATSAATYAATSDAIDAGRTLSIKEFCRIHKLNATAAFQCAAYWHRSYQGGRMWAAWLSYLTSFRDLGFLNLPEYEKLKHYEDASDAGFRVMHDEFCIVSDNPMILRKDLQNRPHAENGPSHQWRDGWSLYHWHGVQVKEHVIMRPETITIEEIKAEQNAEVRRVLIERFGPGDYLFKTGAKIVHADTYHDLPRALVRDSYGDQFLYGSDNSTGRIYTMPVSEEAKTCREAHENICGLDESLITQQS